ncbi:putative protein MJ0907 [Planktothrix tepida]|uniref:Arylsulfatase regulator (Fe-S oxidoreductase) n=1 Tax=Planktothrix tepida PCC 9214 TaxID=671072 RepID=A0A1J1LFC5_9CYAN|nr:radical SAM protein [Planktothrix tepida]CAD5926374.1 putative protein MJ0907 [Planktothrix tepida]CUR31287.1 Arylsulfatase regulator (Fe-S oxidoreductase) [Planktothrix tepida PCC 9214]
MLNQTYKKSSYCQVVKGNNDNFFLYHSLFNQPRIVTKSVVDFLDIFEDYKTLKDVSEIFEGDLDEIIGMFEKIYFLVPSNINENSVLVSLQKEFLEQLQKGYQISRLELAISNACNFGCKHCMHFLNNEMPTRVDPKLNMSVETAKASIDKFVEKVRASGNNFIRVHFGNGEPLINWKVILFCLEYCESIEDTKFAYAINTNLSLLTKQKAEILKKYKVKISTSLDGLRESNDLIRVDHQGQGTFERIISKIKLLQSIDYPIDGFSITVTDANFSLIDSKVIDFAKSIGVKDVSMDFDLVRSMNISVEDCVNKIISLRRYAHQNNLNFYGTWETPYRILMSNSWLSNPHAFCPAMEGKTIEFNVDGTLKTCGHTNTVVGNFEQFDECFLPSSKYLELINSRLPGNNDFCKGCEIEGCCAGQCHVTLESSQKDSDLVNRTCQLMKMTTKALIKEYLQDQ